MKKINAILYKTDGSLVPFILDTKESLETLQKLVGGLIEIIYLISITDEIQENFDKAKDLIVNEEGFLLDLPVNPFSQIITINTRWEREIFRGDIVLLDGVLD